MPEKKESKTHEFDKELSSVTTHAAFYNSGKVIALSILTIVILFGAWMIVSPSDTLNETDIQEDALETPAKDTIPKESEEELPVNKEEVSIPKEIEEIQEVKELEETQEEEITFSCQNIQRTIECESEFLGFECDKLQDNDNTTQWLASYSCTNGRNPCAVSNTVSVSTNSPVNQLTLENRIEKDYYINRMQIIYENSSEFVVLGSEFSQKPFVVNLSQETANFDIHIVEIVGIGTNYLAGISEVSTAFCP